MALALAWKFNTTETARGLEPIAQSHGRTCQRKPRPRRRGAGPLTWSRNLGGREKGSGSELQRDRRAGAALEVRFEHHGSVELDSAQHARERAFLRLDLADDLGRRPDRRLADGHAKLGSRVNERPCRGPGSR